MKLLLTLACSAIYFSSLTGDVSIWQSVKQTDSTVIEFISVNKMPPFKGGIAGFQKTVQKTVVYPKDAKAAGHYGRVFLTFIVELDGSISNIKVNRGIGKGCDEAAVEAVRKLKFDGPAYYKDKPVRMRFNMPVGFGV